MSLLIILFTSLQVALVESQREVSGFPGDNVTLPSGVDPSWTLSKIEWSILANNTWIATYRNEKLSIERFHQYKGRLSLDVDSGNLTIRNLSKNDAMEYTVDLVNSEEKNMVNKIKLTVKERLQSPIIETMAFAQMERSCSMVLKCSSAVKGVKLTWQIEPPSMTVFNMTDQHDNSLVLSVFNSTQNNVNFTCNSSRNGETASNSVIQKCPNKTPQPSPQLEPRCRHSLAFFGGVMLGSLLTAIVVCFCGDKIKAACGQIKAKMLPQATETGVV